MNVSKIDNILPFIDELVNLLYTSDINNVIKKKCITNDDKRVFLMFVLMYFYSYLNLQNVQNVQNNIDVKDILKIFLSDLIKNPDKRLKCIEMYSIFEDTICKNIKDDSIKKVIE